MLAEVVNNNSCKKTDVKRLVSYKEIVDSSAPWISQALPNMAACLINKTVLSDGSSPGLLSRFFMLNVKCIEVLRIKDNNFRSSAENSNFLWSPRPKIKNQLIWQVFHNEVKKALINQTTAEAKVYGLIYGIALSKATPDIQEVWNTIYRLLAVIALLPCRWSKPNASKTSFTSSSTCSGISKRRRWSLTGFCWKLC
jgi:hypothetical protein